MLSAGAKKIGRKKHTHMGETRYDTFFSVRSVFLVPLSHGLDVDVPFFPVLVTLFFLLRVLFFFLVLRAGGDEENGAN
jgi:hypothetical protein